uniref:Uncharacterized protein n=1 Tax=Rhizophora mucronata TaxID=61149 RepID=A0A2P2NW68_RHIMU
MVWCHVSCDALLVVPVFIFQQLLCRFFQLFLAGGMSCSYNYSAFLIPFSLIEVSKDQSLCNIS